jgi:hypothetical protein
VSKFFLNLCVEILKILSKFQKSLKFKNLFFFLNSLFGSSPASPRRPASSVGRCSLHRPAWPPCAFGVFSRIHFLIPSSASSLSPLTDAWASPVSSLSHPRWQTLVMPPPNPAMSGLPTPHLELLPLRLNSPHHQGPLLNPS